MEEKRVGDKAGKRSGMGKAIGYGSGCSLYGAK